MQCIREVNAPCFSPGLHASSGSDSYTLWDRHILFPFLATVSPKQCNTRHRTLSTRRCMRQSSRQAGPKFSKSRTPTQPVFQLKSFRPYLVHVDYSTRMLFMITRYVWCDMLVSVCYQSLFLYANIYLLFEIHTRNQKNFLVYKHH